MRQLCKNNRQLSPWSNENDNRSKEKHRIVKKIMISIRGTWNAYFFLIYSASLYAWLDYVIMNKV